MGRNPFTERRASVYPFHLENLAEILIAIDFANNFIKEHFVNYQNFRLFVNIRLSNCFEKIVLKIRR